MQPAFLTAPTDDAVLENFYRKTRTPGLWGAVSARVFSKGACACAACAC